MAELRPTIEAVLFDVGGVIVRLNSIEVLGPFNGRSDAEGILSYWLECPHVAAHETGRIDADEFARRMVQTYAMGCAPDEFLRRMLAWHGEVFPGVDETLAALRPKVKLACLSNTSHFAWSNAPCCAATSRMFDTQILSHEHGVLKPDPAIYRIAAKTLAVAPERILFFDDTERNVAGAREAGFDAHRVAGFDDVRRILCAYGLLDSTSAGSSQVAPS